MEILVVNTMHKTTMVVILIWQISIVFRLIESRRYKKRREAFRRRGEEFQARHEENMKAIRSGKPLPYQNNSYNWPDDTKH